MIWKTLTFAPIFASLLVAAACPIRRLTVTPSSLTFAPLVVNSAGTASPPQTVTVQNSGTVALAISFASSGYYAQTNNCPVAPDTLAVGASCTMNVTFSPREIGSFNGTIGISGGSGAIVRLSGTGIAPV